MPAWEAKSEETEKKPGWGRDSEEGAKA